MINYLLGHVFVFFMLSALTAHAQETPDWDAVEIKSTPLGDGIYMLQGMGGNLGVSVGEDGVFLIDDEFAPLAPKVMAALREISAEPVHFLLNTHWHGDHTGGNAAFNATGSLILSHDNVRRRMSAEGPQQSPPEALPKLTFSDTTTLYLNGHEIYVAHVAAAHTDGDAVVHFRDANIIHTGDVLFNGLYPFIDLASGGSTAGYIAALEKVAEMADEKTRIIPGHGPLANKQDIKRTIDMLSSARAQVKALVDEGLSLEEVQARDPLAEYHADYAWFFINGATITAMFYNDLK